MSLRISHAGSSAVRCNRLLKRVSVITIVRDIFVVIELNPTLTNDLHVGLKLTLDELNRASRICFRQCRDLITGIKVR